MSKVIAVINQKGGVGKTTTAVTLAVMESLLNKKVLVIDNDAQGNASAALGIPFDVPYSIIDLFTGDKPLEELITGSTNSNVDVIPALSTHSKTPEALLKKAALDSSFDPKVILRERIKPIREKYDYIFIDNAPVRGIESVNALVAADYVLSPVEADRFSYDGFSNVLDEIYNIRQEYNSHLSLLGVLVTKATAGTTLFKQIYTAFLDEVGEKAIKQPIRKDAALADAMSHYMPVYMYRKKTKAGVDYINAAKEMGLITKSEYNKLISWHGLKNDNFDLKKLRITEEA